MNKGDQEELEAIINDIREAKDEKARTQREIDDLDEEIKELERKRVEFEDRIEGLEDDIAGAKASFLQVLEDMTEPVEDPADLVRRAFG